MENPTKENIRKAYDEGCSSVKKTLETLYPWLLSELDIKVGDSVFIKYSGKFCSRSGCGEPHIPTDRPVRITHWKERNFTLPGDNTVYGHHNSYIVFDNTYVFSSDKEIDYIVRKATPEEIRAAIRKFQLGDWVVVLDKKNSNLEAGDVGIITEKSAYDGRVLVEGRPNHVNWIGFENMRKATPEEIEMQKNPLKQVLAVVGKEVFTRENIEVVTDEQIRVPLPHANTKWSFAAFDYCKKFCEVAKSKGFEAYPSHTHDRAIYLNIYTPVWS